MAYFKNEVTGYDKAKQFSLLQFFFISSLLLMVNSLILNDSKTNGVRLRTDLANLEEGWTFEKFLYKFYMMNNEISTPMILVQIAGHFLHSVLFLVSCVNTKWNLTEIFELTYPQWGVASAWRKLLGLGYFINLILLGFSWENWATAGVVATLHFISIILWNEYWATLDIGFSAGLRKEAAKQGWLVWNRISVVTYFGLYLLNVLNPIMPRLDTLTKIVPS